MYILRYWTRYVDRISVTVNLTDTLMGAIRNVIPGNSEGVDRIFVYVAFSLGKVLISNDETHIVVGPPRRAQPASHGVTGYDEATRRLRPDGADILTSKEAYDEIS